MKVFWMSLIVFFPFANHLLAQEVTREKIAEVYVPLEIQTFFYSKYDQVKDEDWAKITNGEDIYYEFMFTRLGKIGSVLVDKKEFVKQECLMDVKPKLPTEVKFYLDLNYKKFRISGWKECICFSKDNSEANSVYNQLTGVAKGEKISLWFDHNYELMDSSNLSALITPDE